MQIRLLTKGEIEYLETVFGDSINYHAVKVVCRPFSSIKKSTGMVICNTISIPNNITYSQDYSKSDTSTKAWFAHEAAHIWQWQNQKVFSPWEAIKIFMKHRGLYKNGYKYSIHDDFVKMNMEQQAAAIEDRILVKNGLNPRNCKDFSDKKMLTVADYDSLLKSFDNLAKMGSPKCSDRAQN